MLFRPPDRLEVTLQPGGFLAPDGQSITVSVLALGWSGEDPDCDDGVVTMDSLIRCILPFVRA